MRNFILRAGIVASLVATATAARAEPTAGAIIRESVAGCTAAAPTGGAGSTHAWMTDALLAAFGGLAGRAAPAAVLPGSTATPHAARQLSAKPHQNPAFPAAFVFQSNSAMFLALASDSGPAHHVPSGS